MSNAREGTVPKNLDFSFIRGTADAQHSGITGFIGLRELTIVIITVMHCTWHLALSNKK
jgi:hypothetical protein